MELVVGLLLGFLCGFVVETKSDVVEVKAGQIYVLEYHTTKWCTHCFDFAVKRTIDKICPSGYEIIDRNNQENDVKKPYTKWLVSCKEEDHPIK